MRPHEYLAVLSLQHPLDLTLYIASVDAIAEATGRQPEDVRADTDASRVSSAAALVICNGPGYRRVRTTLQHMCGLDRRAWVEYAIVPGGQPPVVGMRPALADDPAPPAVVVAPPGTGRPRGQGMSAGVFRVTVGADYVLALDNGSVVFDGADTQISI